MTDTTTRAILSLPKQVGTDNPLADQARAIREQHDKQPAPRNETPRQARLRLELERYAKKYPMTGGKS